MAKRRKAVGFYRDENDTTRPITKSTAELSRKKVIQKPRKFKGVKPQGRSKMFVVYKSKLKDYAMTIKSEMEKCPIPFTVEEMHVIGSQVRKDKYPKKDSDVDLVVRVKLEDRKSLWGVEKWGMKVEDNFEKKYGRKAQIFLVTNRGEMIKHFPEVEDSSKPTLKVYARAQVTPLSARHKIWHYTRPTLEPEILTKKALAEPHRVYLNSIEREENHIQALSQALKEMIRKEFTAESGF